MNYPAPNYTQFPNILLDNQHKMSDLELRVTLAIARETFGWHRKRHKLSLSKLQEMTGMSRPSVISGIDEGIARGTIARTQDGQGFTYELIVDGELVNGVDQLEPTSKPRLPATSKQNLPALVNGVDQFSPVLKKDLKKGGNKDLTVNKTTTTIGTHRDHSDRGGGGSSTKVLPIAAAEVKPAVKAQTQTTTTAPQQADPRGQAQQALIAEIIADRLPSWNGHQTYAAGLSTLDAWRLLTWLWVFDQLARAAESNAYDPDAIREAERIERDYGRIFTGIDNPPGFIRAKVRSGESTHLNAADAAELEEAIVARANSVQPDLHD